MTQPYSIGRQDYPSDEAYWWYTMRRAIISGASDECAGFDPIDWRKVDDVVRVQTEVYLLHHETDLSVERLQAFADWLSKQRHGNGSWNAVQDAIEWRTDPDRKRRIQACVEERMRLYDRVEKTCLWHG